MANEPDFSNVDIDVSTFYAKQTESGLVCNMTGYVQMTQEILELLVFLVTFSKETLNAALTDALKKSMNYAYKFLMSAGDWIGFILAAVYFLAEEYNFGKEVCEAFGYGYYVIDGL